MARTEANRSDSRLGIWKKRISLLAASVLVLATCLVVRYYWGADDANAQAPRPRATAQPTPTEPNRKAALPASAPQPRKLQVMANVSGREIRRQELANACVARFGKEVLESLVNKHLITQLCQQRNITVTAEEIDAEIEQVAKKFKIAKDQWLAMLQKERGINPQQYARDIIWPTLALRKIAARRIMPTERELQEAYEYEFGEAIQARLITVKDFNLAQQLQAQVKSQPKEFARLAREHSTDITSGSAGGLLQPIRKHMGDEKIEQAVFNLAEGQVSPVVRIGEQYAIFRCERRIPPRNIPIAKVQDRLVEKIREEKLRDAASEIFKQVQENSVIVNVYNDPQKSQQMPGVAATINGHPISMLELAEECLARHGESVLEGEINRVLLEEALKKSGHQVTREDIDAEIAHAANLAGVLDERGEVDFQKWIQMVTVDQGVTYDTYIRDAVWPSAALKKIVSSTIEVTKEDMTKGFEANYGPRVRCRAIVMTNLRRAQEVWAKARDNPTLENFGRLAEQYSIEASSSQFQGEVPPIRKHGGRPVLEREAFALQEGEISGVIQVGDKFVILYCEGYTKPVQVNMSEVNKEIYHDLFEKKLRIAMGRKFQELKDQAQIDNYLTGTSSTPKQETAGPNKTLGTVGPRSAKRPPQSSGATRR